MFINDRKHKIIDNQQGMLAVWLGLVGVLVVLAVLGWYYFFNSTFVSRKVAANYLKAVVGGDYNDAYDQLSSDSQDEFKSKSDATDFLKKGDEKLGSNYTLTDEKLDGDKGYYLFEFKDGDRKYLRISTEKTSNGWRVVSQVMDNQKLRLIPGDDSMEANSETTAKIEGESKPTTVTCLPSSYLSDWSPSESESKVFYYKPDSASFMYSTSQSMLDEITSFYKKYPNSNYKFTLQASLYSNSCAYRCPLLPSY